MMSAEYACRFNGRGEPRRVCIAGIGGAVAFHVNPSLGAIVKIYLKVDIVSNQESHPHDGKATGSTGRGASPSSSRPPRSEQKLASDLQVAHGARGGDDAEGGAVEGGAGRAEVDEVEYVGRFAAELELHTAMDPEVAEDGGVHILGAGCGPVSDTPGRLDCFRML